MKQTIARVVLALVLVTGMSGLLLRAQNPQRVGEWAPTGAVAETRSGAASAVLANGTTIVLGGHDAEGNPTAVVTMYDPTTNGLATIGRLAQARVGHSASVLIDGRIAVVGGSIDDRPTTGIEIFDPATGTSTFGGALPQARTRHAAATLKDGRVLVAGGNTPNADGTGLDVLASAEIYDPATGSTSPVAGAMSASRAGASATTLLDGTVLIAGGYDAGENDLATAEIFHPDSAGAFETVPTLLGEPRSGHTAILLPDNNGVLIAGGTVAGVAVTSVDLFLPAIFPDPYSYGVGSMIPARQLTAPRARGFGGPKGHNGYVYVAGGGVPAGEQYRFATLRTDQDDYAPGQQAVITGSGWTPNAPVTLLFQEDPAVHDDYVITVAADDNGNIDYRDWAPEQHDLNVRFYLTASDGQSRAQVTFTDNINITITNAPFAWHRTGEVANGFDVSVSGTYTCNTSGATGNQCSTVNKVTVTVPGVAGSKVITGLAAGVMNEAWAPTTLQFRTSGVDFAIPAADGKYSVQAVMDGNQVNADPSAISTGYFGVDNTAPTTSITCENAACAGPYSFDVALRLAGADPGTPNSGSGLRQRLYCVDDSSNDCVPSSVLSGGNAFTVPFSPGTTAYVRYRSMDNAGNLEATKSQVITFSAASPQVSAPNGNQSSDEGTSQPWNLGSFSDVMPSATGWTVDVDWGDTTTSTFDAGSPGAIDSQNHTYLDGVDGGGSSYVITVKVTNRTSNQSGQAMFDVTVRNVVPDVTAPSSQEAIQGAGKSIDLGSFIDPGTIDGPWGVDVNWGDGSSHTTFTMAAPGTITPQNHTYSSTAGSPYTVTVKVSDKESPASGTATFTVTVKAPNTAPDVEFTGAPATANEGDTRTYTFAITDPDAGQTFTFVTGFPDCGTGGSLIGGSASIDSTAKTGTFQCSFPDGPATPIVRVQAQDSFSTPAPSNIGTVPVIVNNVKPELSAIAMSGNTGIACVAGNAVTLNFSFTDPAGSYDTYTGVIEWGDGSTTSFSSSPMANAQHSYAPGTYTATVKVNDEDPGTGSSDTGAVSHLYQTSSVLRPINVDGSSNFKLGSTVPVKVRITDCTGVPVGTLSPLVGLKTVGGGSGEVNEVVSSSAADVGNTMRYDSTGPQYIFNLSTKRSQFNAGQDLTQGTYELKISDSAGNATFGAVTVRFNAGK